MASLVAPVIVWINAFIPREVPGVTERINTGPYIGKTALRLPKAARANLLNLHKPGGTGYLTDQREFSPSKTASVRMQSMARIEIHPFPRLAGDQHETSGTTEVNIDSGEKQLEARADMSDCYTRGVYEVARNPTDEGATKEARLRYVADFLGRLAKMGQTSRLDFYWTNYEEGGNGQLWLTPWDTIANDDPYAASIYFSGAASDPLVYLAPNIDYHLTFIVHVDRKNSRLLVGVLGLLDAFPAFEAYAYHAGVTKTLFQVPPPPGNSPFNLPGDANSPIAAAVDFS